ncbi:MerR family transcriptional regulator [Limosilactobacillus sp.]
MKISEVSVLSVLSIRTLHYYEREIIPPISGDERGDRYKLSLDRQ